MITDHPWYEDVDTFLHGIRMKADRIGDHNDCLGQSACQGLTHEVGHAFGLFHTHEGTAGDPPNHCSPCMEPSGCYGNCVNEECDEKGDLCCDTALAGRHGCEDFFNDMEECAHGAWEYIEVTNYMSFSDDGCWDHFSDQQVSRMHCWICNAHPGWIVDDDCNDNDMPDVCDITRGDSADCDEDGMPDECESSGACCLSADPDVCLRTKTQACCDALNGLHWYGLGSKCVDIDCDEGPMGPQGP